MKKKSILLINKEYQKWKEANLSPWLKKEIDKINEKELENIFSDKLIFGTSGIRSIIGPGYLLNEYSIIKITQGLINYLKQNKNLNLEKRGIVVICDNRNYGKEFAKIVTCILSINKIKFFINPDFSPSVTPFITYLILKLNACAGIMITASHNAAIYNGYKIYDQNAQPFIEKETNIINNYIKEAKLDLNFSLNCEFHNCQKKLCNLIDAQIKIDYLNEIKKIQFFPNQKRNIKVVFSNLHGASKTFTDEILKSCGYDVEITKSQWEYDGNFPTVEFPNPEIKSSFNESIKTAKKENADIVILNDADGDRCGIAVKNNSDYTILNGNEIGILILNYLVSHQRKEFLEKSIFYTSFVSSGLGEIIAKKYGCQIKYLPTGFKWIINQAAQDLKNDENKNFLFAYEEANGYWLSYKASKDKDGIQAALILSEMTDFYWKQKINLIDVLDQIYKKNGYFINETKNITYKKNEIKKIKKLMIFLRKNEINKIDKLVILEKIDYLGKGLDLIKFKVDQKSWIGIRLSGTEPKLKFYFNVFDQNKFEKAKAKENLIFQNFKIFLENKFSLIFD
jgi:phosphoglucomutase